MEGIFGLKNYIVQFLLFIFYSPPLSSSSLSFSSLLDPASMATSPLHPHFQLKKTCAEMCGHHVETCQKMCSHRAQKEEESGPY